MPVIDNDEAVRDRAYELWEKAGRPSGLEHLHWAEAKRQIELELAPEQAVIAALLPEIDVPLHEPAEAVQLRKALYTPEPFSFELFGRECPTIDLPIVLRAA